jgi:transcriptional regulator with XRE-family HTH domain
MSEVGAAGELDLSKIDAWIGRRFKMRRVMLRISQDELATMIGVTFQQVQKYESGANRASASRLWAIAKVLQVEAGFFFEGIEREFPELARQLAPECLGGAGEERAPFDPMSDDETLQLVNAYWRISNPLKRRKILDFIVSMTD